MTLHRCPDCRCADATPSQPSTSSTWARRQAIDAAAEAVRKAKEARKKPMEVQLDLYLRPELDEPQPRPRLFRRLMAALGVTALVSGGVFIVVGLMALQAAGQ